MAQQDKPQTPKGQDADFAKAFQELAKGEQTASALENHLTALEAKIEALLAQADQQQSSQSTTTSSTTPSSTDEPKP